MGEYDGVLVALAVGLVILTVSVLQSLLLFDFL